MPPNFARAQKLAAKVVEIHRFSAPLICHFRENGRNFAQSVKFMGTPSSPAVRTTRDSPVSRGFFLGKGPNRREVSVKESFAQICPAASFPLVDWPSCDGFRLVSAYLRQNQPWRRSQTKRIRHTGVLAHSFPPIPDETKNFRDLDSVMALGVFAEIGVGQVE